MITRPPEIISVLKIPIQPSQCVFAVFDSHPRDKHPDGAGFVLNASVADTASYLDGLLPFDAGLVGDRSMQWEAQLLGNFSAHAYTTKSPLTTSGELHDLVVESSMDVLKLQTQARALRNKINAVERDLVKAEERLTQASIANIGLQDRVRTERDKRKILEKVHLQTKASSHASNLSSTPLHSGTMATLAAKQKQHNSVDNSWQAEIINPKPAMTCFSSIASPNLDAHQRPKSFFNSSQHFYQPRTSPSESLTRSASFFNSSTHFSVLGQSGSEPASATQTENRGICGFTYLYPLHSTIIDPPFAVQYHRRPARLLLNI